VGILGDLLKSWGEGAGEDRARLPTSGSSLGVGILSLKCFLCFFELDLDNVDVGGGGVGTFSWSVSGLHAAVILGEARWA